MLRREKEHWQLLPGTQRVRYSLMKNTWRTVSRHRVQGNDGCTSEYESLVFLFCFLSIFAFTSVLVEGTFFKRIRIRTEYFHTAISYYCSILWLANLSGLPSLSIRILSTISDGSSYSHNNVRKISWTQNTKNWMRIIQLTLQRKPSVPCS